MVTYGTTAIPSSQITVLEGTTVSVSLAFENSVGLMGGMDTGNGTATEGNVYEVDDPSEAQDLFGQDSELHEAVQLAYQNGAGTVHALPVSETSVTAETQSSQSGTLDNAPIFDPRVNEEHSVSVADDGGGSLTVEYVDEPPTSAPTDADTVEIYPPTGDYYADAAPDGTNYEFDYSYGDYSSSAMEPLLDESPRIVAVGTENESVTNTLATELNNRAQDFDFMHGVTGAQVNVDPGAYSDNVDERRISMPYPSRGYTDDAETNAERSPFAIAGYLASLPLGLSATNDGLGGFTGLQNDLSGPSEAGTLSDNDLMPLLDYRGEQGIKITIDNTTSTTEKFGRVYAMQIVDEMVELSHSISRQFVGDQQTDGNRLNLRRAHVNAFIGARDGTPKLIDDFTVTVSQNDTNDNQTDVEVGIEVVGIMDTVDVTMVVGDIVRNGGTA